MTEQIRRASRLVEIEHRLRKNPQGLTVRELADALGYSMRTIQRDLNVLESELGAPLVDASGRRWQLMPGSTPIGAVRFTLQEARAVYLATRLFLRHADERDPDAESALAKLAGALPDSMGRFVVFAVEELKKRPHDDRLAGVVRVLTAAWAESRTVSITYRSQAARAVKSTDLDTYLLDATATGSYVIGFSHSHGELRTFNLDRVLSAEPTVRPFVVDDLDGLRARLALSWGGAVIGDDEFDVVLEFAADVAERVAERYWHPSQRLTPLEDGRLRFEARLTSLLEFVPWVRSWGPAATVHAPDELRAEIAASLREAAALYP